MTQEQKTKWIEALRSGKFQQGNHVLKQYIKDKPFYCCLGVYAEVVAGVNLDDGSKLGMSIYCYNMGAVPDVIRGSTPIARVLAEMNDGSTIDPNDIKLPMPFTEIADWIEENIVVSE